MATANVSGTTQIAFSFNQTPSTGFLNGVPLPIAETFKAIFRTSGVLADQIDNIHAKTYTFVASTPQSIDLTTITDIIGNTITAKRVRLLAIKVKWTTDVPLIVGNSGTNDFEAFVGAGGTFKVYPSSANNDGFAIFTCPQTLGAPTIDSTHKILKLDPQTAAGDVDVIIGCAST